MEYRVAERMEELPFSGIRVMVEKAGQMQRKGERVFHMELGRPDFDTPEKIKQAVYESIQKGHVFYTSNYGMPELREAVAEKLRRENHVDYVGSEVLITAGATEGAYTAVQALLEQGDEVLVPDPVWPNYIHVSHSAGATTVAYSLREELEFQIDPAELEEKTTERTKVLILVSPCNPTGSVLKRETLEQVARIAIAHDLLVISVEVYERILYDGREHVSIASLPGMKERTITLGGFSKSYSMTGWRLGYLAAPRDLIEVLVRVHQYAVNCASSFVQEAGITALRDCEAEVQAMVAEYRRRRDYVVSAINAIDGLSCICPGGAFYVFVNCKKLGRSSREIADYLLQEAHVAVVPGSAFGEQGEGYLRLSYACSYEELQEACEKIGQAVGSLQDKNRA